MKTFVLTTFLLVSLALPVSSQVQETAKEKAERLAAFADANRQDWQAQYDAGICYADTTVSGTELLPAEMYLARALDIANAQSTMRDTILAKSLVAMSKLYLIRNKVSDAVDYYEKAVNALADELGAEDPLIPKHIYKDGRLAVATWTWTGDDFGKIRYSWDYDNMSSEVSNDCSVEFSGKRCYLVEERADLSSMGGNFNSRKNKMTYTLEEE